ncbi:hypothetical protein KIPB_015026, partial [Kipferlia bialata]
YSLRISVKGMQGEFLVNLAKESCLKVHGVTNVYVDIQNEVISIVGECQEREVVERLENFGFITKVLGRKAPADD